MGVIAIVALLASVLLWQKVSNMQTQLALQSAEAQSKSQEAQALSKQALSQELFNHLGRDADVFRGCRTAFYAAGETFAPMLAGTIITLLSIPIYWQLHEHFGG